MPVRLQAPPDGLKARSTPVTFVLTAQDDPKIRVEEGTRFLGPAERER